MVRVTASTKPISPPRASRIAASIALGTLALLGGCEQILDVPDRTEVLNLTCAGGVCVCDDGYGDCDGDPATYDCDVNLSKSSVHCGACGHSCDSGGVDGCVDGACLPFEMRDGEAIAGPVVFGDKVYIVDRSNGEILSSPTTGTPLFSPVRQSPKPTGYYADLFAGPDGVYVSLSPYFKAEGVAELVFVDAAGVASEPFGNIVDGNYGDSGVAATSDSVYYCNGSDCRRIDRATGQHTVVTSSAGSHVIVRGDDAFVLIDGGIYSLPHGGGAPELQFEDDHYICNAWATTSGFVLSACSSQLLLIFDPTGKLIGETDGVPLHVIVDGGVMYWLDDDVNELDAFDGVEATTVAESQPFPSAGTFKIATSGANLYWGSKNGVSRLVR